MPQRPLDALTQCLRAAQSSSPVAIVPVQQAQLQPMRPALGHDSCFALGPLAALEPSNTGGNPTTTLGRAQTTDVATEVVNVLVVDDRSADLTALCAVLDVPGYAVMTARS